MNIINRAGLLIGMLAFILLPLISDKFKSGIATELDSIMGIISVVCIFYFSWVVSGIIINKLND